MNTLAHSLATQQLASHIQVWAAIPMQLSENNPILQRSGNGTNLVDRLTAFAGEIRRQEEALLKPLGISQAQVDGFLRHSDQYRLLFWQMPLPWIRKGKAHAHAVLDDMEGLGLSLRRIERALPAFQKEEGDYETYSDAPISLGREVTYLRRFLACRASYAEEVGNLVRKDAVEGVAAFYDEGLRRLRSFDPLMTSLHVYHGRRVSSRPPAPEAV